MGSDADQQPTDSRNRHLLLHHAVEPKLLALAKYKPGIEPQDQLLEAPDKSSCWLLHLQSCPSSARDRTASTAAPAWPKMSLMAAPLQKLPVLREDVPACSTQTWIQTLIQTARGQGWPKRSQNVAINAWDIAAERKVRESVKTRLESVLLHHADSFPSWWVSIWESWWADGVLRCWYV